VCRAAQGTNLIAHLRLKHDTHSARSNSANLPPTVINSLQCSALLVKGKAANGRTYFQITATGLNKLGATQLNCSKAPDAST
jgi:hypothetical protein